MTQFLFAVLVVFFICIVDFSDVFMSKDLENLLYTDEETTAMQDSVDTLESAYDAKDDGESPKKRTRTHKKKVEDEEVLEDIDSNDDSAEDEPPANISGYSADASVFEDDDEDEFDSLDELVQPSVGVSTSTSDGVVTPSTSVSADDLAALDLEDMVSGIMANVKKGGK